MPKKVPKKPKYTWVTLTKDFIQEWPEVLDGINFNNLPIFYVRWINIRLKNNVTLHYDIEKELKIKPRSRIANMVTGTLHNHYHNIKHVNIKFNIPKLKKDIEQRTSTFLKKSFI